MGEYYLGIDGGGTKTAACILDSELNELGRGQGGPCNIATGTPDSLRESVVTATRQALESAGLPPDTRFESVCAGVAGYTAKRRRAEFHQLLVESVSANRHRLEPDFIIAYWGATEGTPGVIVSAGTGAVVYGRNGAGESAREDGRGFLLGDVGSGFHIGRQALTQTLMLVSHERPATPYTAAIMEEIGAEDADDLIEWVYRDFNPARIASVAPIVGRLAAKGHRDAVEQIDAAASALRYSAHMVVNQLRMPDDSPVFALGNLWNITPRFVETFRKPTETMSRIDLLTPLHDSAFGAALLAMQADADA